MPARIAPVSVARSTRCVAPSWRAYHSASARISRPSASGLVTSTVRPAAVVMTSVGRIAVPLSMFSQAGTTPVTEQRESELGDRAQRRHDGRAAAHVRLLAHDVGLRLEEVAARVERDRLADERQPRGIGPSARRAARGGGRAAAAGAGLLAADGGERAEPGLGGSMISVRGAEPPPPAPPGPPVRSRSAARRQARGRCCTSARRAPRGRPRRAGRPSAAADHEALDPATAGWVSPLPAAAVVAADDGAFGQRADLLLDGTGRDGSSAQATVPPLRHARTARAAAVRSPSTSGSNATTASGARAADTRSRPGRHRRSARSGAPSSAARAPDPAATRSAPSASGSPAVTSTCIVSGAFTAARSFAKIVDRQLAL